MFDSMYKIISVYCFQKLSNIFSLDSIDETAALFLVRCIAALYL